MTFQPPPDISLDGHRIDEAFAMTTWLVAGWFLVVLAVLAIVLWRFRAGPGRRAAYEHGNRGRHLLLTGALAAAVFISVDMNLVHKSFADLNGHLWKLPAGPGVVRVELMAQQFAWNFRYAGDDGAFGTADDVESFDELRVPAGRPVVIELAAKDVIHSLYLPNLRVKQDATPGVTSHTWFQANQTGRYEIGCAELCGPYHFRMRGELVVQAPDDFDRWLREQGAIARRAFDPDDAAAHWGWAWEAR